MKSLGGSRKKNFAGPDDGGFAEAGTFRWDATVADAATVQQEDTDDKEDDEEDEEVGVATAAAVVGGVPRLGAGGVGGLGSRRRRRRGKVRSAPLPGGVGDLEEVRRAKPWYVIMPESRTHQIFDHLGEPLFPAVGPLLAKVLDKLYWYETQSGKMRI